MIATSIYNKLYVIYLGIRGYVAISFANRVDSSAIFEAFYYDRLKNADVNCFDKEYFKDITNVLRDDYDNKSRVDLFSGGSFVLLILCLFGTLNTFVFQGIAIDIKIFSPIILLIFSAANLRSSLLQVSILLKEALLSAHARLVTSDKDTDLYRFRFPLKNSRHLSHLSEIYKRDNGGKPVQKLKKFQIRTTTTADILILLFILYFLLYFFLAVYALISPGINLIIKAVIVIVSFILQMCSFVAPFVLTFGSQKNPDAGREYLGKFAKILQSPGEGSTAAASAPEAKPAEPLDDRDDGMNQRGL